MTLKQISVFLENKPGALSDPCRLLADAGINLQTFALADTKQFGILRLIVHDCDKALELLKNNGYTANVTEVVGVEVPDKPGGLAGILDIVEKASVNVEYVYAVPVRHEGRVLMAFRFNNPQAGIQALQKAGINVVGSVDLSRKLGA